MRIHFCESSSCFCLDTKRMLKYFCCFFSSYIYHLVAGWAWLCFPSNLFTHGLKTNPHPIFSCSRDQSPCSRRVTAWRHSIFCSKAIKANIAALFAQCLSAQPLLFNSGFFFKILIMTFKSLFMTKTALKIWVYISAELLTGALACPPLLFWKVMFTIGKLPVHKLLCRNEQPFTLTGN